MVEDRKSERVLEWVQHTLSPFEKMPMDDNVRQAILYSAKTALGAGAQNFPEMGEARVLIVKEGDKFKVRHLEDGEVIPPSHTDMLVIDMKEGVSGVELQTRINYVYTAMANAVSGMIPRDRMEILRGALGCVRKYWPEEWETLKTE